ncbi:aspartyl protease family protein [Phenylobacterium sp.]|uniref:aspartyl protease family protein n=1 Tax=Phenylobacterium sp. TaxID=1871053 RepID=UPI002B50810F|nr:aspartyl protease family protein [Phenylobacterium sp.]HLZ74083.1 aspartyl protease family protein [Phenylobacterium sp.]
MIGKIALAALLIAAGSPARADDVQTLIAKYLAWRGGPAFEALQTFHAHGRIRFGGQGGDFDQWFASDGRFRQHSKLDFITYDEAVTSEVQWTRNTSGQIEDIGDLGESDRRTAALAFAKGVQADAGESYTLLPSEQRNGRTWGVVRVSFGGPDTYDLFIDPRTGELLGERITEDQKTRFAQFDDWRRVSGVRMPFAEHDRGPNPADDQDFQASSIQLNAPLPASLFARPASARIWRFADGRDSTGWMDFELYENERIFIPATVEGRPVELLLDSGAGITALDSSFAKQAGIKAGGSVGVMGVGGSSTMQLAPNIEIKLGGLTLSHITAGLMDLSGVAYSMGRPLPLILGKEVLNDLVVDIDFQRRKIAFRDPTGFSGPPGAVRLTLGKHGDNHTIPVSVEGAAPVPFDFDLGNGSPLIVYGAYRDSAHLLDGKPQSLTLTSGVGGAKPDKMATVSSIALGGVQLASVPAAFPDAGNDALSSDRAGGNIGLPVFRRFRLVTDYAHNAIWLTPNASAMAEPFPKRRSGLVVSQNGDRLKVEQVAPGSPAAWAGWKEGVEIVAIDGQKIGPGYVGSPLARWSEGAPGTEVTLSLADGSTRKLTLADYY